MRFTLNEVQVWLVIAVILGILYGLFLGWAIFVHISVILGG